MVSLAWIFDKGCPFPTADRDKSETAHIKDSSQSAPAKGRLVGLILRKHLYAMLAKKRFARLSKLSEVTLLKSRYLKDEKYRDMPLSEVLERSGVLRKIAAKPYYGSSLNAFESVGENKYFMDLSAYAHLSPYVVRDNTPVLRIYSLFRNIGLRHLIVVNERNEVEGIITAYDVSEHKLEGVVRRIVEELRTDRQSFVRQRVDFLKRDCNSDESIRGLLAHKRSIDVTEASDVSSLENVAKVIGDVAEVFGA